MDSPTILVVCTGNVCRSPLVERLLQRGLDDRYGAGAVSVGSAGTGALVGEAMDERSAQVLRELGGSPDGFVARRLTAGLVRDADLVLTATRAHRSEVVRLWPRALRYAFTVRELGSLVTSALSAETGQLSSDPGGRVRDLAARARAVRGQHLPADPVELDIADPYRRDNQVYGLMRQQVMASLPAVLLALGAETPDPLQH